jgi:hypothetical protein
MKMEMLINAVKVDSDTAIEYASNPKRPSGKAWSRYEVYAEATTVGEYFELADKKYARADLRYDEEKGLLAIYDVDGTQVNAPEPEPKS